MIKLISAFEHICVVPNEKSQKKGDVLLSRTELCFKVGESLPETLKCSVCKKTIKRGLVVVGILSKDLYEEIKSENNTKPDKETLPTK